MSFTCSVVVPVRNEEGNIKKTLYSIPCFDKSTEIIFIEGHSNDNTWNTLQTEIERYNGNNKVMCMKQKGIGKWDAVKLGFDNASGDVLMILDGDLTVDSNELYKFYNALKNTNIKFINGSRISHSFNKNAMPIFNRLVNYIFASLISIVIKKRITDSLCGTKVLYRSDYKKITKLIPNISHNDPFGDFTLIFGAAVLNLSIHEIPVHYKERTYGTSNIQHFRCGLKLLKLYAIGLYILICAKPKN